MPSVTITLTDTPAGGVAIQHDFKPAVGAPCSAAQSAALDIINRTSKEYGLNPPASAVKFVQPTGNVHAPKDEAGNLRFWLEEVK